MYRDHGEHDVMVPAMAGRRYLALAINLSISLIIMYLAMFSMIASWGEFTQNLNFLYMALVMGAPMAIVMMLTMPMMFQRQAWNLALYATFGLIFLLSLAGIRQQSLVSDRQLLRSMIPHHSGAILMCQQASIRDPEVIKLCQGIIESQTREIAQMKAMLAR
jgi:uncharacterized protein (DUF305 family)